MQGDFGAIAHHSDYDEDDEQEDSDRGGGGGGGIIFDSTDPKKKKPTTMIKGTRFAPAYKSIFTQKPESGNILTTATHVNCNYLSTLGKVPTLLDLKQHAQSLIILIKSITMSDQGGLIDNENSGVAGAIPFSDGLTFDFLNNLNESYTGPKSSPALMRAHQLPLTSLINVIKQDTQPDMDDTDYHGYFHRGEDMTSTIDVCPLHQAVVSGPYPSPSQPYATHQALIAHANEVLEMIDHEYSAVGGLLGTLPKAENKEQRAKAESTLLGQLILYVQRLVQRIHDLERLYANALDSLASESVVPKQALSALGPDGRKPREMVYPQDRFVLVNAGEDVWEYLNSEFRYREVIDERVAANYKKYGVAGESIWEQRGGKEMSRGITAIDITTRYYRLRGDPLKTIFVVPAHDKHPGTQATRKMESEPTVVAVVPPVWPERISEWEKKHRVELDDLKAMRNAFRGMESDLDAAKHNVATSEGIMTQDKKRIAVLEANIAKDPNQEKAKLLQEAAALQAQREQFEAERLSQKQIANHQAAQTAQLEAMRQQLDAERMRLHQEQQDREKHHEEKMAERIRKLEDMEIQSATAIQELSDKLKANWREELEKVMELKRYVERYQVVVNLGAVLPEGTTAERNKTIEELVASEQKLNDAIARDASLKEQLARNAAGGGEDDADMVGEDDEDMVGT